MLNFFSNIIWNYLLFKGASGIVPDDTRWDLFYGLPQPSVPSYQKELTTSNSSSLESLPDLDLEFDHPSDDCISSYKNIFEEVYNLFIPSHN